jgi:hypothetical protein
LIEIEVAGSDQSGRVDPERLAEISH